MTTQLAQKMSLVFGVDLAGSGGNQVEFRSPVVTVEELNIL